MVQGNIFPRNFEIKERLAEVVWEVHHPHLIVVEVMEGVVGEVMVAGEAAVDFQILNLETMVLVEEEDIPEEVGEIDLTRFNAEEVVREEVDSNVARERMN